MCDPLTIAGAALTIGSTAANYMANAQVERARNDALAAERIRQNTLDQEADALNLSSREQYEDFGTQQEDRATQIGDFVSQQQVDTPEPGSVMPSSSSKIVVNEENRKRGQARDFTDQQALALGNLRSFGDLLGDLGRGHARKAMEIGQIGGFKRGSSGVVPLELDQASRAGDGLRMFGDILGGLGGLGVSAGLSGTSPFNFGSPATTATRSVPIPTPRPNTAPAVRLSSAWGG